MCRRNVYEYNEHLNHKDRGIKYPEYREDVPSRMSSPSKKVAGSDVVTPQSSLLRESVRVDGVVLWSSNNFKRWENCATQERSKCSTAIAETLCVQVRPGDWYVCGVL